MDNVSPTLRHSPPHTLPQALPDAVLWDMDGTIIDTEPQWLAAEVALADRYGGGWTESMGDALIGMSLPESILIFKEMTGIDVAPEQLIAELIEEMVTLVGSGVAGWRPGALELLTGLAHHQVPCALVTMSYQDLADVVLDMLPAGTFSAVITGDQVTRGKPHPEPYLLAADRLGVDITRTVALEDSVPGLASASSAGAWTIGIPAHQSLPASADYALLPTLAGVAPHELLGHARQRGRSWPNVSG